MNSESLTEQIIAELADFDFHKSSNQANGQATIEYRMAKYAALNVDFIETVDELRMYTNAIYEAIIWGKRTTP